MIAQCNFLMIVHPLALVRKINQHDRRVFLRKNINILLAPAITVNTAAWAEEDESAHTHSSNDRGGRPFAPPQALLPATRLKLWVDEVYLLSRDATIVQDQNERYKILQRINERLSNPPNLFQGEKIDKGTLPSTAQLTTGISSANKDQYQLNRKGMNVGDKMSAILNQADVERQWGMLQYAESKREEGSEMRRAFNFYTRQLTFSDQYVLTASKEERKKMIRNDELPTLTSVITSDLDSRDLYRNQFLTAIDDACAEAAYQVKQHVEEADVTDLADIVRQAHSACNDWFSLIAPQDVADAIKDVQFGKQTG